MLINFFFIKTTPFMVNNIEIFNLKCSLLPFKLNLQNVLKLNHFYFLLFYIIPFTMKHQVYIFVILSALCREVETDIICTSTEYKIKILLSIFPRQYV